MKLYTIIVTVLACGLTLVAQDRGTWVTQNRVSQEEKALLETLSHDNTFTKVDRAAADYLSAINDPKKALYRAYREKSADPVKVFLRTRAGREGQYTMTWFTVEAGKITIVEAYFGDIDGSGELQYVREYKPDKITLGYRDQDSGQCVASPAKRIPKAAELCISYYIPSQPGMKVF